MTGQKANPRRAIRRLLAAARHRAFMAEVYGQCVVIGGRRVQMPAGLSFTDEEHRQTAEAMEQFVAACKRIYDAKHAKESAA